MYGMGEGLSMVWSWLSGVGVMAPLMVVAAVGAAGRKHPRFSHRSAYINELGTSGSPAAYQFNTGVSFSGLLIFLFAVSVWQLLGAPVVGGSLALFGLGTVAMGMFPCDPGCPPSPESASGRIHTVAGILAALGAVTAALTFGFWAVDRAGAWSLTLYSVITGGGGLALLFTTLGALGTGFEGILQRLFLLVIMAWLGVASVWIFLNGA